LPQLPWKQKRGFKKKLDSFHQTSWNFVGISYAMWSCAFNLNKGWFFKNCCRCHGNGQNAKKLKKTKMIIAGAKVICLPNFVWGTYIHNIYIFLIHLPPLW
jgi:hypothetical protein